MITETQFLVNPGLTIMYFHLETETLNPGATEVCSIDMAVLEFLH
jgi:hypothetical protein